MKNSKVVSNYLQHDHQLFLLHLCGTSSVQDMLTYLWLCKSGSVYNSLGLESRDVMKMIIFSFCYVNPCYNNVQQIPA